MSDKRPTGARKTARQTLYMSDIHANLGSGPTSALIWARIGAASPYNFVSCMFSRMAKIDIAE
jgi:hypothetical protein